MATTAVHTFTPPCLRCGDLLHRSPETGTDDWRGPASGDSPGTFYCDTGRTHFAGPGPDHAFFPRWRDEDRCAFQTLAELKDSSRSYCELSRNEHQFLLQPKIEIEVWKPNPDAKYPGTIVIDYRRKIQDVLDELNTKLVAEGLEFDESRFTNMTKWEDPAYKPSGYREFSLPWPKYRRIAVFPVTGTSEGHYVHIEVILDSEDHIKAGGLISVAPIRCIALCKTFRGWDYACRISASAARLLQA